ncbi:hypothetical protein GCM10022377_06760 [Zhihengliuella alba]|uniref:Uncharacterized protein n=1 Tax=Zhihengliuella alba TaxID=547018 RepID=A0ABP7CXR2_9MICC
MLDQRALADQGVDLADIQIECLGHVRQCHPVADQFFNVIHTHKGATHGGPTARISHVSVTRRRHSGLVPACAVRSSAPWRTVVCEREVLWRPIDADIPCGTPA